MIASVGAVISVFGVIVFFFVVLDLIKPLGLSFHNHKAFFFVPYSNVSFFGKNLDFFIFPKYRFLNNVKNHSFLDRQSLFFYSLFTSTKFNVFNFVQLFKHF